ncbi:MAG: SemiSWEET transporter [Nanoarchaeota archaeon]|nr:SemiSWEET transporter [Nanoarchaeota archaeon]
MDYVLLLGFAAAFLTTISFLPQVIRVWKLKETKDLSLSFFLIFFIGISLWLIYGIIKKDSAIIAANGITMILASIILYFKFKYK